MEQVFAWRQVTVERIMQREVVVCEKKFDFGSVRDAVSFFIEFAVHAFLNGHFQLLHFVFRGNENLKLAIFHLHQLQTVAPHPALVAASYNAGINRVGTWWKRSGRYPLDVFVELVPVNETRNYIKLVLRNYLYYKGLKE